MNTETKRVNTETKREDFFVSMIKSGRMTKDKAIKQLVSNINHHAKILSEVKHDETFRYQSILNHRAELNRYVDSFKAVSDYQVPVS